MKILVRPELPTASVGSSQAPTAAVDKSPSASNTEIQTAPSYLNVFLLVVPALDCFRRHSRNLLSRALKSFFQAKTCQFVVTRQRDPLEVNFATLQGFGRPSGARAK